MNEVSYAVVRNAEGQFSLWFEDEDAPPGWLPTDFTGTRAACLEHIARVWTDLRPQSLREALESI